MHNWIRSVVFSVCLVGAGLAPLSEANAALNAYLKMTGETQGQIKGGVTTKGREGSIQLISFSHEITSPRDPKTGQATGKRQHKPLVIRKQVDKSSPVLANVLTRNELIKTWEMSVYLPTSKGADSLAYTIKLKNANIASIRSFTDADGNLLEEVSFVYEKIEWVWKDGGITAEDDWTTVTK